MWKEKYEALAQQIRDALGYPKQYQLPADELPGAVQELHRAYSAGGRAPDPKQGHGANGNPEVWDPRDMDALLAALIREAKRNPGVLQLLRDTPEIEVTRQRRTLQMSDTETPGRIAVLIAEKFFDTPQNSGTVTKEFKRRGWFSVKTSNAAVLRPLADIAEMGFLTRDGVAYQAVPGMKVNISEQDGSKRNQ